MRTLRSSLVLFAIALAACGPAPTDGTNPNPNPNPQPAAAPNVSSTSPARDEGSVSLNTAVTATFNEAMSPLTATAFTLHRGTESIEGTVSTSADGKVAKFTPATDLTAGSLYTATLTLDSKSLANVALGAEHAWNFTTGSVTDLTAPTVRGTRPVAGAVDVAINSKVRVTFSEAMDLETLTSDSFTVRQGSSTTALPGTLSHGPGNSVTFTPEALLATSALYTVTLGSTIQDLAGNVLSMPLPFEFTTGTRESMGPAPVLLGTAENYAVLAKTGVSTVPSSTVTGDIGLGPAAASYITGFSLVADSTNVFATSPQIIGRAYAADYAVPTPTNLTTAVSDMEAAYTDAASRPTPDHLELGTGNIGGMTLEPGLYNWTSSVTVPTDVTLEGAADDVWIFQTTGDLTVSAAKRILLSGGAQAHNIFWQVAGVATFGAGSHFEGVLVCKTDVTLETESTMNGRILSQTQVALQQATVTEPAL